jgi:hypothetical protein
LPTNATLSQPGTEKENSMQRVTKGISF